LTITIDKKVIEQKKAQLLKQAADLKFQIDAIEARQIYSRYVEFVHRGRWIPAKFLVHICDSIDQLLEGKLLNQHGEPYEGIIIQQPPQTGKSQTVTETLPSYFLGKWPYGRVIEISYGDDLATRFGRRNKQKIEEFGKLLFNIELSKDSSSAVDFELAGTKGGMISRGIGASITGNPGDLILIDDPYKNRQDADSPSYQKMVIDEWLNTIRTRASAKCKFILIQTRWNEDDLAGYLQTNEPDKWFVISFPLEAEDYEPITGRQPGDALFPEIGKDNTWLGKYKESFINDPTEGGIRAWNALMQQRPTSKAGNMIKREYWQRYKLTLKMQKGIGFDELLQSWDCSFKDTDGTDFVAGGVWGRIGANCFLLDVKYERMDIVKTMNNLLAMTRKWPRTLCKLIEDKANGPAVISMLKMKVPGMIPVPAIKSKAERVNAVLPLWEAGNVYIPDEVEISPGVFQKCTWAGEVIEQCAAFRPEKKAQKDDLVDMSTMALNRFMYAFVKLAGQQQTVKGFTTEEEMKDMGMATMEPRRAKVVNLR
jgi:predicted phage terminase large subunit-like protein